MAVDIVTSMASELVPIAAGVHAWLVDEHSHSATNSGVVISADGLTVIDAGPNPTMTAPFVEAVAALTELPVRRLVFTGSHIDVVGGGAAFPLAAVYGSGQCSHLLDQPADPTVWGRLHPTLDFTDVATRPVSHTVSEPAHLCPASIAVPIPGPQFESLVVQVPGANVVFAGSVATFGVTPLGYEADFPRWIETLDQLLGWGEIFVPAHGPIGGTEEVIALRNYLEAVIAANGEPGSMADGPWSSWVDPHLTAINIERAYMLQSGDPGPPPSLLSLLAQE